MRESGWIPVLFCCCSAAVLSVSEAQATEPEHAAVEPGPGRDESEPKTGRALLAAPRPREGLAFDVRLPVAIGPRQGVLPPMGVAGVPIVAVGARLRSIAVAVGPFYRRQEWPKLGGLSAAQAGSQVTRQYGATVVVEVPVLRPSHFSTLHLLGGATLARNSSSTSYPAYASGMGALGGLDSLGGRGDTSASGRMSYGATLGFGGRVWLVPQIGLGAELGLSYLDEPRAASARTTELATFGTISMAFVL